MALPDTTIADTAELLAGVLSTIDGLRVYPYVADTFRPPGVIVGLPTVDYTDPLAGFCGATFDHDLVLVVSRNSDREAQAALSKWLGLIVAALRDADTAATAITPQSATPGAHTVNGQEMPGYTIRVLVRG